MGIEKAEPTLKLVVVSMCSNSSNPQFKPNKCKSPPLPSPLWPALVLFELWIETIDRLNLVSAFSIPKVWLLVWYLHAGLQREMLKVTLPLFAIVVNSLDAWTRKVRAELCLSFLSSFTLITLTNCCTTVHRTYCTFHTESEKENTVCWLVIIGFGFYQAIPCCLYPHTRKKETWTRSPWIKPSHRDDISWRHYLISTQWRQGCAVG